MARLLSEAVAAFRNAGVAVAHVRFRGTQAAPYAEIFLDGSDYFYSDDRTTRALCDYEFVLYTRDRDLTLEFAIEAALDAADITYRKAGGYHADADLVATRYSMKVYER